MGKFEILKNKINIPTPVYFVVSIILITLFLPREDKDKYTYAENRPWKYGLLTAPFDFHIHKSNEKINLEKDSISRIFIPYYFENVSVGDDATKQFTQKARSNNVPGAYIDYVQKKLKEIYKAGIIPTEDYEELNAKSKKQIRIKGENNITVTRYLKTIYTQKLAYEKILNDIPSNLNIAELKEINIADFLIVNIIYDEKTSSYVKEGMIQQIPMYEGMVQSGEKIIDRGEIVDSRTYAILNSYLNEMGGRIGNKANPIWMLVGQVTLITILMFTIMFYLRFYRKREYYNKKNVIFILLLVCTLCIVTALSVKYKTGNLLFTIPFAISIILIRTFIDSRTAMIAHIVTILLCALILPQTILPEFILIQIIVGYITIFSLKDLSERSQLIYSAIFILFGYIIIYTALELCMEGNFSLINPKMYLYFCINFIFITFSYLLVYICEKVFGFISEVSMIELSNINRPLLQELSEIAPGTFQHSMQVSNLVSAAAVRIGANASLVRTGALYHDIGKMKNPAFFTENQTPGMNPHANLSYKESARIIIGHVEEGIKIAKKYGLPQQIIDFIETHHGKGKAKFFYNSYKNEHPDEDIDESDFTYPGPNPFSRETALLMMADTVEAASRSLIVYTEESISKLVDKLIDMQLADGLLKNTPMTFSDIEMVKEVFIEKLKTIYHSRIAYPELKDEKK